MAKMRVEGADGLAFDTHTKWNSDVMHGDFPFVSDDGVLLTRLARWRIFGKSPIKGYLRLNRLLWDSLSPSVKILPPIRLYGNVLPPIARMKGGCGQAFVTHFLRNRPQLELIERLVGRCAQGL